MPPRQQYEAWGEWFSPLFGAVPRNVPTEGFLAENKVWRLGELTMSRILAPGATVERKKVHLRRSPVDHWVLSFCRYGTSFLETRGISLRAPACTPFLWSLGAESLSKRTAVDRLQLFLPRDSFRNLAPLLDAAVGSVLTTPLGDFMLALERNLQNLTAPDLPRLTDAVGGLVAACVAPSAERLVEARGSLELGRMERVRQAVHKNLRSAALSPESLCRMVAVSRSQLYRMLEGAGGVARYIQRQRLLEAHRVLCDAAPARPIFEIAEDFCFEDASSFSRAFRREFGLSPSEVRAAALAGLAPAADPHHPAHPKATSFAALLRPG
ncbi:MAG: helix-turn-helix domain-containing protein [Acetobacteraceae bacterium]